MPTYTETRTKFKNILTRRDCTDADADGFLQSGLNRINRRPRVAAMEKRTVFTLDAPTYGTNGFLTIPSDYAQLKDITIKDGPFQGRSLVKRDLGWVQSNSLVTAPGVPEFYARSPQGYVFAPSPIVGTNINFDYYAGFPATIPASLGDSTILTNSAQDLLVFGGLFFAGLRWSDKRRGDWNDTFEMIVAEMQLASDADELVNGAVSPAFTYEDWVD